MRKPCFSAVACATVLAWGTRSAAEEAKDDDWRFYVTPYLFAAGLDGSVGLGEVRTDIDMGFSEVFDYLDMGLMVVAEAHRGRWIVGIDAMYIKLSDAGSKSVTGPFGRMTTEGTVEASTTEQIYQPSVGYRVLEEDMTLDMYGAARYTSLESEAFLASTTTIPSFPGGTRTLNGDVSWWDPIIGSRVQVPFADEFAGIGVVDFGGFGVGSDFSSQWIVAIAWQFSQRFSAKVGYRYLSEDYDDDTFVWDMVTSGFVTGLGFNF